jgi:hypothetical protein
MRNEARVVAAGIVVAGIAVAAAVAVTGRYAIAKHYLGSDVQAIYGINSWTGEPFVKQRAYDRRGRIGESAAIG